MLNMEQSSEELHWNMIKKKKNLFLIPVIRPYIAIFVTFFFFYKYPPHRLGFIFFIPALRYFNQSLDKFIN